MSIDLPPDLVERIQKRAALVQGDTDADVIRKALDSLDWQDSERRAIQEGIDAWQAGNVQNFDEFDRKFCQDHGMTPDA